MLIGSSLKMYFGRAATVAWTEAVADICAGHAAVRSGLVEPFVIPTFPSIPDVVPIARRGGVRVGAQDVHWEDSGAFTGEVSAPELVEHGVCMVEIGHAERRRLFGETDGIVAKKVRAAFRHGLVPVLCIGETERATGEEATARCLNQLDACLAEAGTAGAAGGLVVAYEPVWAIGAPAPASADHIRAVAGSLRERLREQGRPAQVIYGGSAGPGLLSRISDSVDGMFLGRLAHDPAAFGRILDEAMEIQ